MKRIAFPSIALASCFVCTWTVHLLRVETLKARPTLWADNIWVAYPKRKRLELIDVEKLLSR